MMKNLNLMVASLFAAAVAIHGVGGVKYDVINRATGTPGGARFDREIGANYCKQVMSNASFFIWKTFNQAASETKKVNRVVLIVDPMDGATYNAGDEIHLSADRIAAYNGDVRREVTGEIFHEMTHVWQWNGGGTAPQGLLEGIADWVRMKAGYPSTDMAKVGAGKSWDQGNVVTAQFLDYCNSIKNGTFVADLNGWMKDHYTDLAFLELTGRSVFELWTAYVAIFG